ncbi:MAG TPA: hypothetical protein VJN18_14520 [Polyangiaceae bacterium]|nr:hypothetical protein [Polyangiaceae bacterium]
MTRAERIARIRRDLVELKSRLQRIEGETFAGKRNVDELVEELKRLEKPESEARDG